MKRIARVFPCRTTATPTDDLAFIGEPGLFEIQADKAHISWTFSWHLREVERLLKAWSRRLPTTVGGPALGDPGEDFVPGMYIKPGYVITSRGCPNRCWFCSVWKREGGIRELPITEGWNVLDDNLLACSSAHIAKVFIMLSRQKRRPVFSGGIEAARLRPWHAEAMREIGTDRLYCAYDTADDLEPLVAAGKLLQQVGFTKHHLYAYVLMGYPGDTLSDAETRLRQTWDAGFMPTSRLYYPESGQHLEGDWERLHRKFNRPAITRRIMAEVAS